MGEDALKLFCLSLAALAVFGCKPTPEIDTARVWRVNEVLVNVDALNGKTVRVSGYLGVCEGYDCGLFQDKRHIENTDRWLTSLRSGKSGDHPGDWLGVGGSPEFDATAKPFNHSYVVITARVSNQCRFQGKPACTDRAEDLIPLKIAKWNETAGGSGPQS